MKLILTIIVACLWLLPTLSFANVDYRLSIDDGTHHLANVAIDFPETEAPFLDVKLPSWRTGRYEILDMANGIRMFDAKGSGGVSLKWHKIDSNTWRINLKKRTKITVKYQVYANELGLRSRHIDNSHAFIDASGFFMFAERYRAKSVTVTLDVPNSWRSVSGMINGVHKHQFVANNYDILVDSPIETGINQHVAWQVDGRDYELVVWGHGNYDIEQIKTDLKKLVKTGSDIWHDYPYERYVFMIHATSGARGATEHLNSTIIQRHRDSFSKRDDYISFMTTASHEFVHTWNVKAYRPQGLVPYNYVDHNYSNLLWIAEGSTSYFDDQLLVRGDIISVKEYFKALNKSINRHFATPGRKVQSASETSFDKWINQSGDHAKNFSTNIYAEGSLISLALDIDMLKETNGKVSYRDVHKVLYKEFALPKGYTDKDIIEIASKLTKKDYNAWWRSFVETPADIDFASLFETVGLTFGYSDKVKFKAGLNVETSNSNGVYKVRHVARDSNAWRAGLTTDDEIIAINGLRISEPLDKFLARYKENETVSMSYFRRDTLYTVDVVLSSIASSGKTLQLMDSPTKRQKQLFKAWLGVDYPKSL